MALGVLDVADGQDSGLARVAASFFEFLSVFFFA